MGLAPQAMLPRFFPTYWTCFACGATYIDDQLAARRCREGHGDVKAQWALAQARNGKPTRTDWEDEDDGD